MVRPHKTSLRRRNGVILFTALLIVTGLATLTTVGLTRAMTEQRLAAMHVAQAQLFGLAEAGLDDAMRQLKIDLADSTWNGLTEITNTLGGTGDYAVTITPLGNYVGVTLVDDVLFQLDSTGCFQWDAINKTCIGSSRTVTSLLRIGTRWKYAILGDGSPGALRLQSRHTLQNTTLDAYDSTLGNYGVGNEGLTALLGDLTNTSNTQRGGSAGGAGSAGGSTEGPVLFQVTQQSGLQADVESNLPLQDAISVSANSTWEGQLFPLPASQTIYPVTPPLGLNNFCQPDLNDWGSYTWTPDDGGDQDFTGGVTICAHDLTLDGIGFEVGAQTQFYITGTLTLKNGASLQAEDVNGVKQPIGVQIYIMNTDPTNQQPGLVMDDSVLHAGVYAPGRAATITGGAFYGAMVASQVSATNTAMHQDRGIYGAKLFQEESWHEQ